MKKLFTLLFAFTAFFAFHACDDDDEPEPVVSAIVKEVDIDASAYDKWVYFSFEDGELVGTSDVEEKKSGTDWDIAFHRWDVRLNCGESGSGQGGAQKMEGHTAKTGWDAVVFAPETGYSTDGNISVSIGHGAQGAVYQTVPASDVITGGMENPATGEKPGSWMNFKHLGGGQREYEITNQIFVIKTAEGKYVKVWLKQYLNAENEGGHITMKYAYQADGSTKLD